MATYWRAVRQAQTVALVTTAGAVGYYFISPSLRVQEMRVPKNSMLAKAPMFGTDEKKVTSTYEVDPYRDCFAVTVPKEVLAQGSAAAQRNGSTTQQTPEDLMLSYARSFITCPVFQVERAVTRHLLRSDNALSNREVQSSDLRPGMKLDSFEVVERTDKELLLKWHNEHKGSVTAGYTWLGVAPSQPPGSQKGGALPQDTYWDYFKSWTPWASHRPAAPSSGDAAAPASSWWPSWASWGSQQQQQPQQHQPGQESGQQGYWGAALHAVGLGSWAGSGEADSGAADATGVDQSERQSQASSSNSAACSEVLDGSTSVRLMFGSAFWHVSPAGKVTAEPNQQVVSWPVTLHKWYSKLLLGSAVEKVEKQVSKGWG